MMNVYSLCGIEIGEKSHTVTSLVGVIDLMHALRPVNRPNHFALKSLTDQIAAHDMLSTASKGVGSPVNKVQEASKQVEPKSLLACRFHLLLNHFFPFLLSLLSFFSLTFHASRYLVIHCDMIAGVLQLSDILKHPVALEILKDQAVGSRNTELLSFYCDVQAFKQLPKSDRPAAAQDILDTYISVTGSSEINIGEKLRDVVYRRVMANKDDKHAFDEAEREATTLIRRNVFEPFMNTPGYRVCQTLLRSATVFTTTLELSLSPIRLCRMFCR
jgi:hypothetical protein